MVQIQTPIEFMDPTNKGSYLPAVDGIALYIGETTQTFYGRYSSASQMSSGLQSVIDDFGARGVRVQIYSIATGNAKFDEEVARNYLQSLVSFVTMNKKLPICLGNRRGMKWKQKSAHERDLMCE